MASYIGLTIPLFYMHLENLGRDWVGKGEKSIVWQPQMIGVWFIMFNITHGPNSSVSMKQLYEIN